MRNINLIALICILFSACQNTSVKTPGLYYITDFGAVGDSTTVNTITIQKAIDEATKNGGGKVIVPPGVFITGSIFIKDNVTFEVQSGAKLVGSPKREDYKYIRRPMFRYHENDAENLERRHLININKAKNVTLCGNGTIHGNGKTFWQEYEELPAWIHAQPKRISNMVEVQYSENVKIKDLTLTISPEWTMHIFDSKNILIDGIFIDNGVFGPNNDGIDITGCENITISNCNIITCDDAICFKTALEGGPCINATVTNCLIKTNCVALKLGSNLTFQTIKDITFSNCVIYESSRGIGIYSTRGATFENINFSNITCDTRVPLVLNRPIHISVWNMNTEYQCPRPSELKNITISNFTATTDGRILMVAQDSCLAENITLRDVKLIYPFIEDPSAIAPGHKSHQGSPKNPIARGAKAAVVAENLSNLVIENLTVEWPKDTMPQAWKIPKKIENGTNRIFNYKYDSPRQTELSVLWAKNVKGGYISAPLATPSDASIKKYDFINSTMKVKE